MSEFDDFVEDENSETKHQPKVSKNTSKPPGGSQQTAATRPSASTNIEADTREEIVNSIPTSWDREQFAMFFKEAEVFEYEDQMHDAKGHLKHTYNVRNEKRYEIDQAFIELALERVSPDEIAARLIENRGFDTHTYED